MFFWVFEPCALRLQSMLLIFRQRESFCMRFKAFKTLANKAKYETQDSRQYRPRTSRLQMSKRILQSDLYQLQNFIFPFNTALFSGLDSSKMCMFRQLALFPSSGEISILLLLTEDLMGSSESRAGLIHFPGN